MHHVNNFVSRDCTTTFNTYGVHTLYGDRMFKTNINSDEPPVKRKAKVYAGHNSATVNVPAAWDDKYVLVALLPEDMQQKAREQEANRRGIEAEQ